MPQDLKGLGRQFILFCAVGSLNTVAALIVIILCSEILGLYYILSNIAGYAVGLGIGFILHRRFSFRRPDKTMVPRRAFIKFLIVFALAYIIQLAVVAYCIEAHNVPEIPAQITGIITYTVLNFLGNKFYTFY